LFRQVKFVTVIMTVEILKDQTKLTAHKTAARLINSVAIQATVLISVTFATRISIVLMVATSQHSLAATDRVPLATLVVGIHLIAVFEIASVAVGLR
jgi:hypothetical protein